MSKNKGYNNYYKKPQVEEPANETIVEEVQATEETVETSAEEAPVEEEKVETITPAEPIKVYAVVSGAKRVNLRVAPNTEAKVLEILNEGTKVEIHDSVDRVWSSVTYNGTDGYMMTMYLRPMDVD